MRHYGNGSRANEYRLGIDSEKEIKEAKEFLHQRELELRAAKEREKREARARELAKLEAELHDLLGA
ncbi:hypothetical protein [Campylobacter showae]|uniref:hypothetical protein n=1 Tax=Campylobacter showae TaxID=204 RepID=UPI0026F249E4|nr:hypothetical protein [Campylobacter showae]